MYKKLFLIFVVTLSLKVSAQNYILRTSAREMCGNPGDVFVCSFSFTNTTSSSISLFINRYQKTLPPYWSSCYCYEQCHSPLRDTITINIPPFSTDVIYVQFKTDSVNPGTSISDFAINQLGIPNITDSVQLSASTDCNLSSGLSELQPNHNLILFPNPASDDLKISVTDENLKDIRVYNALGQLTQKISPVYEHSQTLNVKNYDKGVYFIELYTDKSTYLKRFIKD